MYDCKDKITIENIFCPSQGRECYLKNHKESPALLYAQQEAFIEHTKYNLQ